VLKPEKSAEEISKSSASTKRLLSALLLGRYEEFGDGVFQCPSQAFKTVEGRSSLPPLDEVEEVQGHGRLLRKLFLRHLLREPDLTQPRTELFSKSTHTFESSETAPE
jgi:hypothetical protein